MLRHAYGLAVLASPPAAVGAGGRSLPGPGTDTVDHVRAGVESGRDGEARA